ncbi:hypothetical protein E2C01_064369 [Portunus trituberculatus]|uniref:Uncharacterized protein n=1 Tax=Portunus trituberculatus TaxID=210409 RepID=A0A5B7HCU4_PORTR|nr:hypothetical protein [Portunus trituberculatus]
MTACTRDGRRAVMHPVTITKSLLGSFHACLGERLLPSVLITSCLPPHTNWRNFLENTASHISVAFDNDRNEKNKVLQNMDLLVNPQSTMVGVGMQGTYVAAHNSLQLPLDCHSVYPGSSRKRPGKE